MTLFPDDSHVATNDALGEVSPLVTILTVCLNSAREIEDTIRSITVQTYKNLEYIVVDGGSTDGTLEVIRHHAKHIARWISEPDRGISDAFNKGISMARGQYIGILSAGDQYEPDFVARAVRAFSDNRDVGFVYGDINFVDTNNVLLFTQPGTLDLPDSLNRRRELPRINHPAMVIRSNAYREVGGYDLTYRVAMDYDYVWRMHLRGTIGVYVPGLMTYMRMGGVSTTNYRLCRSEERRIFLQYGYGKFAAQLHYVLGIFRSYVRVQLARITGRPNLRLRQLNRTGMKR